MRCIVGRTWASSALHCMKERRAALIWSLVPQQLELFPGLKTERSYSVVVLDRSQAPPSSSLSVAKCWVGSGNEAVLVSQDYLSTARAARLAFSFVLDVLSLCSFCSVVSTARQAVMFNSTFLSFQAPLLFVESFAGHFENTIVPHRRLPKLTSRD